MSETMHYIMNPDTLDEYEPKQVMRCNYCYGWLYEGDEFAEINDMIVCENCISDMTKDEILKLTGCEIKTARKPSYEEYCGY